MGSLVKRSTNKQARGFTSEDRRRFDAEGRRRKPLNPHLPTVDFETTIRPPLSRAFSAIRRRVEETGPSPYWPRRGRQADIVRGFLISLAQLQRAVIALVADKRPDSLVLPAQVLCRTSIEGLGNLLAFLDHPEAATRGLQLDDYVYARRIAAGNDQQLPKKWPGRARERRVLRQAATFLKLSKAQIKDYESLGEFPTTGVLGGRAKRRAPLLELQGTRKTAFLELYDFWYRSLSRYAHQRLAALQLAVACFDVPDESGAEIELAKSSSVALTTLALLCGMTEVDAVMSRGKSTSTDLAAAWGVVQPLNEFTRRLHAMRYGGLVPASETVKTAPRARAKR